MKVSQFNISDLCMNHFSTVASGGRGKRGWALKSAAIFCREQGAGCRSKFNYNWKTTGTKNN